MLAAPARKEIGCFESDRWPPEVYRRQVASAVAEYLHGDGPLSLPDGSGPVQELERLYRGWARTSHALSLNSGTSALLAAYYGLGVGPGDEVLISAYSYHAVATTLLHLSAIPVLCDVDPVTGELDLGDAAARITSRTRAVVVTHLYGYVGDLTAIRTFADRYRIVMLEDASHAHGASRNGTPVGSVGDAAVFSLQENKLAPAGEGGVLVTNSQDVFERAMTISDVNGRLHRLQDPSLRALASTGLGLKLRLHPLAAVAGLVGAEFCQSQMEHRRQAGAHYGRLLGLTPLHFRYQNTASYYLYRALLPETEPGRFQHVLARAEESGFPLRRASLKPLYAHALLSGVTDATRRLPGGVTWPSYRAEDFPGTERHVNHLLSLPSIVQPRRSVDRAAYAERLAELWADS